MFMRHAFRGSPWKEESIIELHPQEIILRRAGETATLPLEGIASVRISSMQTTGWPNDHECVITTHEGDRVVLRAMHSVAWGVIEDRTENYREFVRVLLEHVALENHRTKFTVGRSLAAWIIWSLILIASTMTIAGSLVVASWGALPWPLIPLLLVLMVCYPMAWRGARDGGPRAFDPLITPSGVLPG